MMLRKSTEQEYKAIRSGTNKGLLDVPFLTWRCACGNVKKIQIRAFDMTCGKCKKGMECTQTKGMLTVKEMYRKVAR